MPLLDAVAEGLLKSIAFVVRVVAEAVVEVLFQGVGHWLIKLVRPSAKPSDGVASILGFVAVISLVVAAVFAIRASVGAA